MKNKSIISKVITGAIMAGMFISTNTIAFADRAENTTVPSLTTASTQGYVTTAVTAPGSFTSAKTINLKEVLKSKLDTLVTAGTITSDQETAILNALTPEKGENLNLKTQLKAIKSFSTAAATSANSINIGIIKGTSKGNSDATVTIETADSNQGSVAVVKAIGPVDLSKVINLQDALTPVPVKGENFKTKLDALVTAGTITSDQETAVLNLFKQNTNTTKTQQ